VLTAPEFRNRGFARMLMKHTLDHHRACGIPWVKLDPTEMGAKLNSDFDFQFEYFVERWHRGASQASAENSGRDTTVTLPEIVDQDAFGVSRAALLHALLQSGEASVCDTGFALWRSGSSANYFGPCVAGQPQLAEQLLRCGLQANSGLPMLWDLPPQNSAAVQLANKYGFSEVRKLSRMACRLRGDGAPPQAVMPSIFALAGFEYG
jgi:hypothetical protein